MLMSTFAACRRLALVAALAPFAAQAKGEAFIVDCWDETFAYTTVGLRAVAGGHEIWISSQSSDVFAPIFEDLPERWGEMDLRFVFDAGACVASSALDRFSCAAEGADRTIELIDALDGAPIAALEIRDVRADLVDVMDVRDELIRKTFAFDVVIVAGVRTSAGSDGGSTVTITELEDRRLEVAIPPEGCVGNPFRRRQ